MVLWGWSSDRNENTLQIEPGFKVLGKLEEEVPGMFKRLRYPFPISKTALVAVGSPHTWPPLLAALAWLVELLNYSERALSSADLPQTPEALADRDTSGDREFFEYVSKSYRYFLSGDDEMCAAVDEETEARFIQKDEQTREDIGRLEKVGEDFGVRASVKHVLPCLTLLPIRVFQWCPCMSW